ncbi:hypothetical protein [Streptomyces sp. NBC_00588]|jgi:hypothetical protein|nr:hypothetical protein [Streptomyces sp. NBC_00588]WUB33388.1 hypothetical protein OHN38_00005 [Streptomyces sp. NBC_00588]WUB41381.1 hypothetical protein OHN38_43295 [Streptomyces sp. NBC_00588]
MASDASKPRTMRWTVPVPQTYLATITRTSTPHVVWARYPCLYRSTATERDPADGMYGFITRMLD